MTIVSGPWKLAIRKRGEKRYMRCSVWKLVGKKSMRAENTVLTGESQAENALVVLWHKCCAKVRRRLLNRGGGKNAR